MYIYIYIYVIYIYIYVIYIYIIVGKGGHTLPFLRFLPFRNPKFPNLYQAIGKTKVLNNSCNQFVYNFGRMFTKVVTCKPDITSLTVFWSIL